MTRHSRRRPIAAITVPRHALPEQTAARRRGRQPAFRAAGWCPAAGFATFVRDHQHDGDAGDSVHSGRVPPQDECLEELSTGRSSGAEELIRAHGEDARHAHQSSRRRARAPRRSRPMTAKFAPRSDDRQQHMARRFDRLGQIPGIRR